MIAESASEAFGECDCGKLGVEEIAVVGAVGAAEADGDGGLWRGEWGLGVCGDGAEGELEVNGFLWGADGSFEAAQYGGGGFGGFGAADVTHEGDIDVARCEEVVRPGGELVGAEGGDFVGGERLVAGVI